MDCHNSEIKRRLVFSKKSSSEKNYVIFPTIPVKSHIYFFETLHEQAQKF
jgi:hypothetical protein